MDTLLLGDCLDKLKELSDDSVDSMITDPPYGISFMGKDWDTFNDIDNIQETCPNSVFAKKNFQKPPRQNPDAMIEFFVPIWKECYRVLKSGAFAFVMCSPRADVMSKQIQSLELAGFETKFTPIYWTYASGFPKSGNLSKMVDKRLGNEREKIKSTGNLHISNTHGWSMMEKKEEYLMDSNKSSSPQAKKLDGCYAGFQPKPAVEVIIVAMKPLVYGTYIDQALAWCDQENIQIGGTWLDDCRIPFKQGDEWKETQACNISSKGLKGGAWSNEEFVSKRVDFTQKPNQQSRFPANLLVQDDILNDTKIHGVSGSAKLGKQHTGGHKSGFLVAPQTTKLSPRDSGSFSRYFDLDFWFQNRIKYLPQEIQKIFPFLKVPKASKSEKEKGLENLQSKPTTDGYQGGHTKCKVCGKFFLSGSDPCVCNPLEVGTKAERAENPKTQNIHPTVKPLALMQYLVVLSTRPEQVVLDPFVGSGTTAIAAHLEGRKYIAIEKNQEYYELAKARIKVHTIKKLSDYY